MKIKTKENISIILEDILYPYKNELNEKKKKQLLLLVSLLKKWNKTHNITSIIETEDIISKHLFDSLSIKKFIDGAEILDVGTGGGFPGIPLAILSPQKNFTLVDSSQKKVAFLYEAKRELGLLNTECIHSRVESLTNKKFHIITSRAFGSLVDMVKKTKHLIKKDGLWLAMKGNIPKEEVSALDEEFVVKIEQLSTPKSTEYNRHLVIIRQQSK